MVDEIKKIAEGRYEKKVIKEETVMLNKATLLREKESLQKRLAEIEVDIKQIDEIDKQNKEA